MATSSAQATAQGSVNLTGGNIIGNDMPVWMQASIAAAILLALMWFLNRKGGR